MLEAPNEKTCGMCDLPICSDQCQVLFAVINEYVLIGIIIWFSVLPCQFYRILIFNQVGVNHYTECQVFRNLGRTSSYNDLAFKLAAIVPLRLLLKVKEENKKGFNRLQFLLDTQTNSPSSFLNDDEISTQR